MRTLLVLAKQSGLAAAIRAVLSPEQYRVLAQEEVWQAENLLLHGTIDAVVIDADLTDVQPIRIIKQIRRLVPVCPIIMFSQHTQWEWEEEAYLLGVSHILSKPVRSVLLNTLLERVWEHQPKPADIPLRSSPITEVHAPDQTRAPVRTLEALRDFSAILTHSLCSESLLKQFLLLLREILGVNRAAIFLRRNPGMVIGTTRGSEDRRLQAACALGLPVELLEQVALSLESGIGRHLYRSGRILKNGSDEARSDLEIQKEFEFLGVQVAIPMLDRESLVGVAVFDGRLTGEFFGNEELALIFHLLESMGLAIKNSWLHDQLVANHEMMADVLNQLSSGCLVVGRDLSILHVNEAGRRYLGRLRAGRHEVEFGDLPQSLGSKVFDALKTGQMPGAFKYKPDDGSGITLQVTIAPFKRQNSVTTNSVLMLLDDVSQQDRAKQLEIEAANVRLIKLMAERLAHEIGNASVPIETFEQLTKRVQPDAEALMAMTGPVREALRRVTRLSAQILYLARERVTRPEPVLLEKIIREAFEEAQAHYGKAEAQLKYDGGDHRFQVMADKQGLRYAFFEILLNALQNSPGSGACIMARAYMEGEGKHRVKLEVEDPGPGFTQEAVERAGEAFFTTRNVGVGLGLTVSRKIIEMHEGTLQIPTGQGRGTGLVCVSLPLLLQYAANGSAAVHS